MDDAGAMADVRYRIAPKARLVFDSTRGKHMLIYPERGLELNAAAHAILSLCDGHHSVARIIELLTERFARTEPATLERDVTSFIAQLVDRGVLLGDT
jgi:pyrroloquinoline quinone biosynthesis protein D